jgi:hypothetical protein
MRATVAVLALVFLAVIAHAQQPRERPQGAAVRAFKAQTGYPHGRAGFVVDHKIPICAGGPDVLANLQWQPLAESYQKDTFERSLCRAMKEQGFILARRNGETQ